MTETPKIDEISVATFKATCLTLMPQVAASGRPLVVTKRGKPLVEIRPVAPAEPRPFVGCMAGTGKSHGDLTEPVPDAWEADAD